MNPILDKVPPANPDSARQSGPIAPAEQEVHGRSARSFASGDSLYLGGMTASTNAGALGPLAKTLEPRQQLLARDLVIREPCLDVTMADLHLGDPCAEGARSELKGIQPQSSRLAREGRRYDHPGDESGERGFPPFTLS